MALISRGLAPVALLACAALAGACTVSTEPDAAPTAPPVASASIAPVVSQDSTGGAVTSTVAATTTPTGATSPPTTAGPPARGVTAGTIKIGYATIDFQKLKDTFGVDVGFSPPETMEAFVAATNAAGGINGRQVELVVREFLPVGEEEAQRACRELIEDEQVFAVMGWFIGDTALCVTDTYATPYFGNFGLSPSRKARSKAPFVISGPDEATNLVDTVQLLLDEGVLTGKKVGVLSDQERDEGSVNDLVVAPLRAAGIEVVSQARLGAISQDAVAGGNEMDRVLQRFEADGVDTVVAATGVGQVLPAFGRTSYRPQLVGIANGQYAAAEPLTKWGVTDPSSLVGAMASVAAMLPDDAAGDPQVLACFDAVNQYTDIELTPDDIYPPAEREGSKGAFNVAQACQLWNLVVAVLTAAGPNPNAESIVAGLDTLADFQLIGGQTGHLSSTNWAATRGARLFAYDESKIRFLPVDGAS